jgi:catechol 2,3-dioxygenase-like lactoylglutathione lyase family enzyme
MTRMDSLWCAPIAAFVVFGSLVQGEPVSRPKIPGLAHVAFYVSDLAKARAFYEEFLGFDEEPFTLKRSDGTERIAFIKINDNQYVELFAEEPRDDGRLNHVSISTDDIDRLRAYLAASGIKVPDQVGRGQIGNRNFNIKDPDGHTVEIVEYQPDSWTTKEAGKHMPDTRISSTMMHAGFLVGDLEKSMKFYHGILGFTEFWRGSGGSGRTLSWVNMRVPDGQDYVEFMLYSKLPPPDERGTKNHISLMVPDAVKAVEELKKRAGRGVYGKEIAVQVGVNRRRQVNLFDPDGTRVELMEPVTIDGRPAPSSTAPPPRAAAGGGRMSKPILDSTFAANSTF